MIEPIQMKDVKTAAMRLFKTTDGVLVLKYLEQTYYDNKIKTEDMERQVGSRDVVRMIKNLTKEIKQNG